MNFEIRNMFANDLPEVLEIEQAAFGAKHPRDPLFLEKYLELSSAGCLVATNRTGRSGNNKICGFVFSHINGPVGWLGLLAVHPDFQKQTIGKTLFLEALNFICSGTETFGLQLPSDSAELSAFLIKSGFQFVEPQIILSAKVSVLKSYNKPLPEFSIAWEDIFKINEFAVEMEKTGLTAAIKLENTNFNYGSFVIETKSRRLSNVQSVGVISTGGCLRNLSSSPLTCGLSLIAEHSELLGFNELYFALNSFYSREIEWLCNNGCEVRKIVQRLVHTKSVSRYKQLLSRPQIDLTNWSI